MASIDSSVPPAIPAAASIMASIDSSVPPVIPAAASIMDSIDSSVPPAIPAAASIMASIDSSVLPAFPAAASIDAPFFQGSFTVRSISSVSLDSFCLVASALLLCAFFCLCSRRWRTESGNQHQSGRR